MLLYFVLGLCLGYTYADNRIKSGSEEADSYYPNQEWSDTFDWKLLKALSPQYQNVLISPISLKLVLALLYEGSSGLTERELKNVLQFPEKKTLRENYQHIIKNMQPLQRTEYLLNIGTRVFLDANIKPKQAFAAKASSFYQADIEPTYFSSPENASLAINSWVEKLTNGKVQYLVKPDDLQDAIMLLTNAVYFKGTWRHQFPKNQTRYGKFYVSTTEMIDIPYMSTTDEFYFHESTTLDATILRLPYKGTRYSMFIILPASKGGLPNLIQKINLRNLHEQLYYLDKKFIKVTIPKFQFNFQARYAKILQDFGLHQMFQNTASFPGIAIGNSSLLRQLVVSDIIQKSGIELDEEGSVVYAASDVTIGTKFGEPQYSFNATHPFLFFIEEAVNGTILFVGKVENPLDIEAIPLPNRNAEAPSGSSQSPNIQVVQSQFQSSPNLVNNLPNWQNSPKPVSNLQPTNFGNEDAIVNRFNYFDLELLSEFGDINENVFLSPASIKVTLAMILEGAKGICAQEISEALRIPNINQKGVREALSVLLSNLNEKSGNSYLEAANAIFVAKNLRVLPEYRSLIENFYRGLIQNLDFTNTRHAVDTINYWVSNATRGSITNLVGPQTISGETSVVLTNALYFKGKWKQSFDVKDTKPKCFKTQRGCVSTPMMTVADNFNYNYISKISAHAVEIPYEGKFSMLILLPTEDTTIRGLIRDLQHFKYSDILDHLKPSDLTLEIPKFQFEYSADLVEYLKPLRIREIFQSKANLTGIVRNENIKVNNLVHKTKIEVDEQGTVAAAATGAVVIPLMGSTALVADRPFVFFIYHRDTGNIIFEGILKDPLSSGQGNSVQARSNHPLLSRTSFPQTYYQDLNQQNVYRLV